MIDLVIPTRESELDGGLKVRRALPFRARRMVGPFIFLDEMGPVELADPPAGDVPPHPHIGLSTVTYLFEGEILHRDSLGSKQLIRPGDINWMTAGRGIVHSERPPAGMRSSGRRLNGIQAWVALPLQHEEAEPSFEHYAAGILPEFEVQGARIKVLAGSAYGRTSPVKTHSSLFYLDVGIPSGKTLSFEPGAQESALYLATGHVTVDGQSFDGPTLVVFKPDIAIQITAHTDTRCLLLGGAPLEGPRHIYWNFVSSSRERIERAKDDWRAQRFPRVPEETDFVPLPS
jgi:redox-sensitive bicupin YhaK (pirin superfamily)